MKSRKRFAQLGLALATIFVVGCGGDDDGDGNGNGNVDVAAACAHVCECIGIGGDCTSDCASNSTVPNQACADCLEGATCEQIIGQTACNSECGS